MQKEDVRFIDLDQVVCSANLLGIPLLARKGSEHADKVTLDVSKARPDLSNSSWAFRFALVSAILVLFFTMLGPIGSATVSHTSAF